MFEAFPSLYTDLYYRIHCSYLHSTCSSIPCPHTTHFIMSHQEELVAKISEQLKKMEDRLHKIIQTALAPAPLTEYVRKKVLECALGEFEKTVVGWEKDMTSVLKEARTAQDSLNEQLKILRLKRNEVEAEKQRQIEDLAHIAFKMAELDARERDMKSKEEILAVDTQNIQEKLDLIKKYEVEVDRRASEVKAANTVNVAVSDLVAKIEAIFLRSQSSAVSPLIPHGFSTHASVTTPRNATASIMSAPGTIISAPGTGDTMASPSTPASSSSEISRRMFLPITPARNREFKR